MTSPRPLGPTDPDGPSGRSRRPRRSGEEVRRLIVDAALQVFESRGFAQAKTRDIAALAGVYEPDIFRHFDSKAKLFEVVVLGAVSGFMREFTARWDDVDAGRPEDIERAIRDWVDGMYRTLRAHRHLMRTYLSAATLGEVDGVPAGDDLLGRLLAEYERIGVESFGFLNLRGIDVVVTLRASFGMIMSLAVYDDLLFAPDDRPTTGRILDECTAMIVTGWLRRVG